MTYDPVPENLIVPLVDAALAEDVGAGDVTTRATVPASLRGEATLLVKEPGTVCGLGVLRTVFHRVEQDLLVEFDAADGDRVEPGQVIARIRGRARAILVGERTALNFLQHLSGIATAARAAADRLGGTRTRVLDTRKTLPGMRLLAKYAVRCGGGVNHRVGLHDMILIKENHVTAAGGVAQAVRAARADGSGLTLEIEVTSLAELEEALTVHPDHIMLDNFSIPDIREATRRVAALDPQRRPVIEVSGGVTLETLADHAVEGVDFISMGALTHSVRALDISLELALRGAGAAS